MTENTTNNTNTTSDSSAPAMICPVCGKSFFDVHTFASHMSQHSAEAKRREEYEKKKRLEKEKKGDLEHLNNLRKVYEDASVAYIKAKDEYEKKHGEKYLELNDFLGELHDLFDGWNSWRRY